MSLSDPATLYAEYGRDLAELLERVLAGEMAERTTMERQVVRCLGALAWLHQRHQVDEDGHCSICRVTRRTWWRPRPQRTTCTVHTALNFYLRQPERFVLAAIADEHYHTEGPT